MVLAWAVKKPSCWQKFHILKVKVQGHLLYAMSQLVLWIVFAVLCSPVLCYSKHWSCFYLIYFVCVLGIWCFLLCLYSGGVPNPCLVYNPSIFHYRRSRMCQCLGRHKLPKVSVWYKFSLKCQYGFSLSRSTLSRSILTDSERFPCHKINAIAVYTKQSRLFPTLGSSDGTCGLYLLVLKQILLFIGMQICYTE